MDPPPRTRDVVHEQADGAAEIYSGQKRRSRNSIYALQVQAFVDAAEVVDAEPEVIEDLLADFVGDSTRPEGSYDEDDEVDVGSAYYGEDAQSADGTDEWDTFLHEAQSAWSKAQVKEMMICLKESGITSFINEYIVSRAIPIPTLLYAFGVCLCPELREKSRNTLHYCLKVVLSRELQSRNKISELNTIDDAVNLIRTRKRILVLTGAGISVSCGIPDFRSRHGLYTTLQESGEYELDDPQQMFDITYFRENPSVFYSFASKIYPSRFIPSPCHRFIKAIEDRGKLLRNYTQNIDTLETLAGVKRVLQCHGSFATASCLNCRVRIPGVNIEDDILNHRVPLCKVCSVAAVSQAQNKLQSKGKGKKRSSSGWNSDQSDEPEKPQYPPWVMKPDITFFGEKLSDEFDRSLLADRQEIDLLVIIGTSLKVSPVSDIIAHLPHSVPQILINKTPVKHINPDIVLLGDADDIVQHLCKKIGWDLPEAPPRGSSLAAPALGNARLKKRPSGAFDGAEPERVGNSHVWLFEGAEGGKWLEEMVKRLEKSPETVSSPDSGEDIPPTVTSIERKPKKVRTQ
ncbi:uncharacterized protein FIBRA_04667 [Fibroporia radiculosa]|uniref:Deacetylase sirtuin-type domain-containing protein n=1 Tax=Fibroporia radiculosa TaxID=599839 RepID=J4H331_9APHY|nr:uncharacterized protein FIBRA_04667 [Fibroporia radiculosa]CCM02564.1 predicted protein [Fibroporia radiculosa]